MARLYVHSFETTLGTLRTAATDRTLALVALPNQTREQFDGLVQSCFPQYEIVSGGDINREAEAQLMSYLQGKLRQFMLGLEWYGTPFQQKVLKQVASIPYGELRSYRDIARAVGHPNAFRAVGSVNARNRLPLVIPCHRVVASNGLGGYGGGLEMKRQLLKLEGALKD